VVEELARGGMAVVYHVRDHLRGGQAVALKLANAGSDPDQTAGRFVNELRLGSSLAGHPNVVGPVWGGNLDGPEGFVGRIFLVTELAPGVSLDLVMGEHRTGLPMRRACAIGRDVASALGELHRRGIVHRDVKPGNVMVAGSGEHERARLIDFGLAYATGDGWEPKSPDLTEEGVAPGTPLYMSPEQAAHVRPAPAFDVYSLGVMLYELFSGSPPYEGYVLGELLARKCDPKGTPFSLGKMCPELPKALAAVVEQCLRYEPSERPAADEVARVLARVAGGERVGGGLARSRGWLLAAAGGAAVIAAVAVSRPWDAEPELRDEPEGVAEPSTFTSAAYAHALAEAGDRPSTVAPDVVEGKATVLPAMEQAPAPERRPGKVRKPEQVVPVEPVAEAEVDRCPEDVAAAKQAALRGQWETVLRLTKNVKCWSEEAASERRRLRARALFETEQYVECAALGVGSGDASLVRRTEICKARAAGENGLP
jgi:hypothetical protein